MFKQGLVTWCHNGGLQVRICLWGVFNLMMSALALLVLFVFKATITYFLVFSSTPPHNGSSLEGWDLKYIGYVSI